MTGIPADCEHNDPCECGSCGAVWCYTCDPQSVSALCHYCHGRGYSIAEIAPPREATPDAWRTIVGVEVEHDGRSWFGTDVTGLDDALDVIRRECLTAPGRVTRIEFTYDDDED